jgi:RimJ/RimL family protein N-acetyltransferase
MTMTNLRPNIRFRPLAPADLPLLHGWLARPHVAEWWSPTPTLAELAEEYGPLTGGRGSTRPYLVLGDGEAIGFIQSYVALGSGDGWWEDEQDPGVRGIDQFLANADQLGRGIGTAMVGAFVRQLFTDPAVTLVQTDPAPDNARAIRCYWKAGFRPVRELVTPDGPALLMVCRRELVAAGPV